MKMEFPSGLDKNGIFFYLFNLFDHFHFYALFGIWPWNRFDARFRYFFPLPIAIAATAIVHLANNIFKAVIVGKFANWNVVFRFGIPAALASSLGAYLLGKISGFLPILKYFIQNHEFEITFLGLIVGLIIVVSSYFELSSKFSKLSFPPKYLPLGGVISGFFGGISGYQGVFRSAFLIKAGLDKKEFIGTSVISSILVDVVHLAIYGWSFYAKKAYFAIPGDMKGILIAASLTAFLGSYIGSRLIEKVTFNLIQVFISGLLFILGIAIIFGLI